MRYGFIVDHSSSFAARAPARAAMRRRRRSPPRAGRRAADLADVHADAPGIAWFKGDVDAAFKSAQASNKPVLLYWGAQWCPPCKQLKSAVFNRPDFIEKSKLFVAVYLDGDLPDAQKWGDVFRVTGYPTVVVFKPDRTEITRIAGNMDLSSVRARARRCAGRRAPGEGRDRARGPRPRRPLAPADCRRLAYHAFGLEDEGMFDPREAAERVRERRAAVPRGARQGARAFHIPRGRRRRPTLQKDAIEKGGKADKTLTVLIVRVNELLANKELAHGQCRRVARAAEGVLSRRAPDAAADRARACASASWPSPMRPPQVRNSRPPISSPRSS